ncbi:MAG: helix-turn-helix domain-containing protein [Anaerohalosphaera sp.]|nr:helix-turn-helix domain-containing protein [Anaerohalosphaera sp.]
MTDKVDISNIVRVSTRQVGEDVVAESKYFFFETSSTFKGDIAIICGGYEKCGPAFDINRVDYPFHVVKYTIRGKGTLTIGGQRHKLQSGVLSSFSPGVAHEYKADPSDPMEHIFITFIGAEAKSLLKKSGLSEKGSIQVADQQAMLKLVETILNKGLEKSEYAEQICGSYLRILLMEMACEESTGSERHMLARQSYLRCKRFIDENFSEIYSMQQVADECDINVRYMSRLFKEYSYITPHQYVGRLKMNKAVNLLLNTPLSVAQVGLEVGYEDQYHFSRVFSRHHGASPRNYRRQHM